MTSCPPTLYSKTWTWNLELSRINVVDPYLRPLLIQNMPRYHTFLWRHFVPSLLLKTSSAKLSWVSDHKSVKSVVLGNLYNSFEKMEIYNFKLWKVRPLLLELQVEGAGCRMEIMASRRLGWSQFETWILRCWHRKHIWNLLTPFTREKAKRTYFQF